MNILSNNRFWEVLAHRLRRLFPHCSKEQRFALTTLMRVMQAVMFANDTTKNGWAEPYDDTLPNIPKNFWSTTIYRTIWSNVVSGIQIEIEWNKTEPGQPKSSGIFVITSENWEVVLVFEADPMASKPHVFEDACYFLKESIMLSTLHFEGSWEDLENDMLLATLSLPDMETGEVFYEGDPW